MKVRILKDNDYTFGNNMNDYYVDSPEAVARLIEGVIEMWLGEYFLDTSLGTPYLQEILGNQSIVTAGDAFRAVVLSVPYVTGIETFNMTSDQNTRILNLTSNVNTQFGQIPIDVQRSF